MEARSTSRRSALRSAGTALVLSIAGCLGDSPAERQTVEMTDDLTFESETVTITQGGTVTWENVGSIDHTVTAYGDEIPDSSVYFASGGFDSEQTARRNMEDGLIAGSETFEHTFDRPGRYGYYCIPHESAGMTGTIRVE